ncbi:MAG: PIN domain-containing protein [Gaiellaceae bacterium]
MTYLLDTNVVSEPRRPAPDVRVAAWFGDVDPDALFVSVLSLGEARVGIERLRRRRDHRQAEALEAWLAQVKSDFADRVLAVSAAIADRWGRLNAGRPLPIIDGLLAATAIEHGLTLVTRDTGPLEGIGVSLLDPWAA